MEYTRLRQLLDDYARGTLGADELEQLRAYFHAADQDALEQILAEDWKEADQLKSPAPAKAKAWQQLHAQTTAARAVRNTARRRVIRWSAIAAAVAILLIAAWWITAQTDNVSNGTQLVVNDKKEPMRLDLSDGTKLWLSQGAAVRYPTDFSDSMRSVQLDGRAYFDVAKDANRPFTIQVHGASVQVLGTSFDLMASRSDSIVKLALVEGRVKMAMNGLEATSTTETIRILEAGEEIRYHKKRHDVEVDSIASLQALEWRSGIIYFDGADVEEIGRILEQWYGLKLIIPQGFRTASSLVHRFNTREVQLEDVLESISQVTDFHFEKKNEKTYEVIRD